MYPTILMHKQNNVPTFTELNQSIQVCKMSKQMPSFKIANVYVMHQLVLLAALMLFVGLASYAQTPTAIINYGGTGNTKQTMALFRRPTVTVPRPAVLFLHSGMWNSGSRGQAMPLLDSLYLNDFVVFDVDYRPSTEVVFPGSLHDVKRAVRWIKSNAATLRVDTNKIGVLGYEAGGHLGAMLATSSGVATMDGSANTLRTSTRVHAVMLVDAPTNFLTWDTALGITCPPSAAQNAAGSASSIFLGCVPSQCASTAVSASPITYVNSDEPRMQLHHGIANCTVPWQQSAELYAALQVNNINVQFVPETNRVNNDPYYFSRTFKSTIRKFFSDAFDNQTPAHCSNDSSGLVPLIDMGNATFQQFSGGLYGQGSNLMPQQHRNAGLIIANQIRPTDAQGLQSASGKIGFVSLGMSNTNQEYSSFMQLVDTLAVKNPALVLVNAAQGGKDIDSMQAVGMQYWQNALALVRTAQLTPEQVQVAWIKSAKRIPSNGIAEINEYKLKLKNAILIAKQLFPNLKQVYISSRSYGGYNQPGRGNPEPYAWYNGFSVQQLILDQVNGDASLAFNGPGAQAPWMSWGPYIWADGKNFNSQGLNFVCPEDYESDGVHLSNPRGRLKVSSRLLNFMLSDSCTRPWFTNQQTNDVGQMMLSDQLNLKRLSDNAFQIEFPVNTLHAVNVFSATGQLVQHHELQSSNDSLLIGLAKPSGVYYLQFIAKNKNARPIHKKIVVY